MTKTTLLALAACMAVTTSAHSQSVDFHEELKEWVFQPCTEVQAALDAPKLDYDTLETAGRSHWADFYMSFREDAIKEFGDNLGETPNTWKQRAELYETLLRICLSTVLYE